MSLVPFINFLMELRLFKTRAHGALMPVRTGSRVNLTEMLVPTPYTEGRFAEPTPPPPPP